MTDDADTLAEGAKGHSLFAPSGSAGWMNCADYLLANHGKPDNAGEYAAEGTVFHSLMDGWFRHNAWCYELGQFVPVKAGGTTYKIEVDQAMLDFAADCAERIQALYDDAPQPADLYAERRVDFSDLVPALDQGGTCDLAICSQRRLVIRDYKYGKGVRVDAKNNSQLLIYAYGFFNEFDWAYGFETINIGILQPRLDHWDEWEITREELLAFAEVVRERAALAWEALQTGGLSRTPSPKACLWCGDKPTCAARAALLDRLADDSFDDLEAPTSVAVMQETVDTIDAGLFRPRLVPAAEMTTARLARILPWRKDVEKYFKDVEAELLKRAIDGEEVPDHKVVEGRSHRKWRDETAAEKLLVKKGLGLNEFWEMTPISVAQAIEKLKHLGVPKKKAEELLEDVVVKPPGRPTLAPDGDNRAGLTSAADDFDDIEGDL